MCNRLATAALGIALFALLARCAHAYFRRSKKYSRASLRSLLLFAFAALVPSVCISLSMALQGHPPVNYLGYTSFLLPLGLAVSVFQWKTGEKNSVLHEEANVQKMEI